MSVERPNQMVLAKERTEDWYKDNAEYLLGHCTFDNDLKSEAKKYFAAIEGLIDKSEYSYVLNPYNNPTKVWKTPARIRNLNIIAPVINLLLGEMSRTPVNHTVVVHNSDRESKEKRRIVEAVAKALSQDFVNNLNDLGINTGLPNKEVPDYQNMGKTGAEEFNDELANMGDDALHYIRYHLKMKSHIQTAFYDWLACGMVFSYKDCVIGDLTYEIVPYYELSYPEENTTFIEDRSWAVRRMEMSGSKILEIFRNDLKEEHIKQIEAEAGKNSAANIPTQTVGVQRGGWIHYRSWESPAGNVRSIGNNFWVYHFTWKTMVKVGKLTYTSSITGETLQREVSDEYVLDKANGDVEIEWDWINEVHEVYKIDMENPIYLKSGETLVQRDSINNSSVCKLPYNGKIGYVERATELTSIVKMGYPYQLLFNIYNYRGELVIAKNRDKVAMMPKGLLASGFDEYKFMYFLDTMGIGWYDETKPNAAALIQAMKSIDMGLGSYLKDMSDLMTRIKQEWWDSVGFNRQRFGGVYASDGKGTTEQAIFRSSLMTAEIVRSFGDFIESDFQGLLDYSKVAFLEGKTGYYVTDDKVKGFLKILPDQHMLADYGVYITDMVEEKENVETVKMEAKTLIQNKVPASFVAKVMDSKNFRKIKQFLEEGEKIQQEYEAAMKDKESEAMTQIQQMKDADKERDREVDRYKTDVDSMTKLTIAENNNATKLQLDQNNGESVDIDNVVMSQHKIEMDEKNYNLALKKFKHIQQVHKDNLTLQRTKLNKTG